MIPSHSRNIARKCLFILLISSCLWPQEQTVGLFFNEPGSYEGYSLFSPMHYNVTYLINNDGLLINSWQSTFSPGLDAYILPNGNLLRTANPGLPWFNGGGGGGLVQEFDWEGNLLMTFPYGDADKRQHHDIEPLPNGNFLLIAWEKKTYDEAIEAGRNPEMLFGIQLWPDHIVEVEWDGAGGGNIVWEWHIWDHLIQDFDVTKSNYGDPSLHPELIDINFVSNATADWTHTNSVDYLEKHDLILLSVSNFDEIWVIDHGTTTAEAAGHSGGTRGKGGDLLYRWGNPRSYGAGSTDDQQLFGQHQATWVPEGFPGEDNILIFNNGGQRPDGNYSTVDEIEVPLDSLGFFESIVPGSNYAPEAPVWRYIHGHPPDFFASFISGAERLMNGNTLINHGPQGIFFEVTPEGDSLWMYVNPVASDGPLNQGDEIPGSTQSRENSTFRASRYAPDYAGFAGRDLTPGAPIELYPVAIEGDAAAIPQTVQLFQNYPNPFNPSTSFGFRVSDFGWAQLNIYDIRGKLVKSIVNKNLAPGEYTAHWDATDDAGSRVASGVYMYRLAAGEIVQTRKMLLVQ